MKTITLRDDGARIAGHLTISTYKNGRLLRKTEPMPNKVVSSDTYGRNLIARALSGDDTYPITIDSAAFGDDNTAAADGDTALGNSLVSDIPITAYSVSNDELQIDVFVADANLANDTYEEMGFFCDSRLFSRIIISPAYTKADGEDTLFTYTLTLSG